MLCCLYPAETSNHKITKTLLQQNSLSGIGVHAAKSFWPHAADDPALPAMIPGTLYKWVKKADFTISVDWVDGRSTESLAELLAPDVNFALLSGANGGPPPVLRGQAAAQAAQGAAPAAEDDAEDDKTVSVSVTNRGSTYDVVWKVREALLST